MIVTTLLLSFSLFMSSDLSTFTFSFLSKRVTQMRSCLVCTGACWRGRDDRDMVQTHFSTSLRVATGRICPSTSARRGLFCWRSNATVAHLVAATCRAGCFGDFCNATAKPAMGGGAEGASRAGEQQRVCTYSLLCDRLIHAVHASQ